MRILQLKTSATRGGAETLGLALTDEFLRSGHVVHTVFREAGWMVDCMRARGISTQVLSGHTVSAIASALHVARRFRPDVILSHGAVVSLIGCAVVTSQRIPMVTVEHNIDDWRHTKRYRNLIDRYLIARLSTHRIAVSMAVANMLRDLNILPQTKVTTIPNGINLPDIRIAHQRIHKTADKPLTVIAVGRLVEQKGHVTLIDAAAMLLSSVPNLRILILGDGPDRSSLQHHAETLGIARQVTIAGPVDNVAECLASADIFVLPSLWEGLPIALLEAMAAGLPCIATHVSGIPEVIIHGVTGLLIPPRDPGALAAEMLRLIKSDSLRSRIGASGCDLVYANHDITRVAKRYLGILEASMNSDDSLS